MRLAVFSDVHGNLEALEIFLDTISLQRVDRLFCLGDSIGYGPNPNECLELLRSLDQAVVLMGNHEWAALNLGEARWQMNPIAFKAMMWTEQRLTKAGIDYIRGLPISAELDPCVFFHDSAYRPERWDYIRPKDRLKTGLCLEFATNRIVCVGHTHKPMLLETNGDPVLAATLFSDGTSYRDDGESKLIVNPGSIGQPRDHASLPSYIIYDSSDQTITWHRLSDYDPSVTAEKILSTDLPSELAYYLTA
jgi:predicted phosphodiesterase